MGKVTVTIKTLSPLHLGSGQENIIVDSDVVHDQYGMPYFPAKRFRGVLYESALELAEMGAGREALTVDNINTFFGRNTSSENALRISNFYLTDEGASYESLCDQWKYLQHEYSELLTPEDVLSVYTTMRYYLFILKMESLYMVPCILCVLSKRAQFSKEPSSGTMMFLICLQSMWLIKRIPEKKKKRVIKNDLTGKKLTEKKRLSLRRKATQKRLLN